MKHNGRLQLGIAIAALAAVQCANPGTPTGGPRDRRPPRVVQSKPVAGATGFSGKQVTIYFDENIQVKDAQSKFVISPPLAKQPRVEARGEMLRVDFGECELQPSTTYTLDFADCVSDLNEGNIFEGFTFTFSTGESTDSMMISGNIYDALTLEPMKGLNVVLQSNTNDTAFRRTPPTRIAKTDELGRFAIKNIPDNRYYRVYGLDDQNRNFVYDQPGEKIAWLPDSFMPAMETRQLFDSVAVDSLMPDSTIMHSWQLQPRDTLVFTPDSLILFAYTEDYYDQYIMSDDRPERNKLRLIFNNRMPRAPRFAFPDQDSSVVHALFEPSANNDTVTVWLTDTLIYKRDSVVIAATYPVLDSLKNFVDQTDTLVLWHFDRSATDKNKNKKKKKEEEPEKPQTPKLRLTAPTSLHLYSALSITSPTPYDRFDWKQIHVEHKVDTLYEAVDFSQVEDSVRLCYRGVRANWQAGEEYRLTIDSAAVSDVYGLVCDKHLIDFKITSLDRYGTLYINVDSVPEHALLQLVNGSDKVARQVKVPANGKAAFRYLNTGTYMLRILIDENENGEHDIGNFEQGTLPEQFIYYMEKIEVRANWDIKIEFCISDFTPSKYVRKFKAPKGTTRNRSNY